VRARFHALDISDSPLRGRLTEELFELWVARALQLSPDVRAPRRPTVDVSNSENANLGYSVETLNV
jgi:hypothetical protein